jgi:AhpD family alkylhydroperoxidase
MTSLDAPVEIPVRFDFDALAPSVSAAVMRLHKAAIADLAKAGVEQGLIELIRLRASQLNGCAYCVDMHSLDARVRGETEQRLYAVPVWHDTPFFTERERAALLWTDKLTLISLDHVPDEVYAQVRPHFTDSELANLTLLVATINAWNRIAISFRTEPGHYTPAKRRP